MFQYVKNLLIALDQLLNTILGGHPDETLSSRAYHLRRKGDFWASNIINGIFFWQRDHCRESKENIGRKLR